MRVPNPESRASVALIWNAEYGIRLTGIALDARNKSGKWRLCMIGKKRTAGSGIRREKSHAQSPACQPLIRAPLLLQQPQIPNGHFQSFQGVVQLPGNYKHC